MLPLRPRSEVRRTLREGRRAHSPAAVLHARLRGAGEQPALGARLAVVSARGFRNAVSRNRARRLLREACRLALLDLAGAWDLVLLARPPVAELPFAARLDTVKGLLRQAGVV